MKRFVSAFVLLSLFLLQVSLALVPATTIASAAGNVTINDFTSTVTKGTIPLEARLNSNVTGEATRWRWSFYNPQTSSWSYSIANKSTGHSFGSAGAYGVFNVTLEAWGPEGNDSLTKIDYVIANQNTTGLPVANFSASTSNGDAPLKVTFTDNSIDANSSLWYFGMEGTSTAKDPTYTFTSPGIYRVVLEVNNSNGWDATAQEIVVGGQGKVLPVPNFAANTLNNLNVQFTDTSQNGNGAYWSFGDGAHSTEISPSHNYSSAGSYIVSLAVSNENGTSSISKIINVQDGTGSSGESDTGVVSDTADSSGSGGGSGTGSASIVSSSSSSSSSGSSSSGSGGVGGSPEPQSNVEAKEVSQAFIGNGNFVNFAFPQNATPIMNLSFGSKTTAGKTTTIVEMLKNQSTLVSGSPSDETYKFINIWVGSGGVITPDKIENATVSFKVEKAWVQEKNIDRSSITLNRYSDGNWTALPTNLTGEDDKYLYFTAQPADFSFFAITGKAAVSGNLNGTSPQAPAQSNEQSDSNNATDVKQPQNANSSGTSGKTPGFEIISGIIGLLAAVIYKRK